MTVLGGTERLQEPARARMDREQRERADVVPDVAVEAGRQLDADMRRLVLGPTDIEVAEAEADEAAAEARIARERARDVETGRFVSGGSAGGQPVRTPGQNPNSSVNDWIRGSGDMEPAT
jgi:hypothetical protein